MRADSTVLEGGERLVGDAALTYDFPSGGDGSGASLDVAFGGIRNIDRGTAHTVETVVLSGLAVARDGTLPRGQSGARIQGGGDAETGFGVDVGGGIAWTDPARGLSVDLRGRGLASHDSQGFRDAGLSGSLSWVPDAESGRGPSLTLTQTMGGQATGGADALLQRGTLAGLAANDDAGVEDAGMLSRRRLEVRFGYGFAAFGDRFTATPELGFGLSEWSRDYRLGWRLGLVPGAGAVALDLSLEAMRRETANDNGLGFGTHVAKPEHAVGLRLEARF